MKQDSHRSSSDGWRLRAAGLDDVDGLHALASKPLVHRYLFDGAAPEKDWIARRLAQGIAGAAMTGNGVWLLESNRTRYAGCIELRDYPSPRTSEIAYLLDPAWWRQGLAVRMAWTAITQAFHSGAIDAVMAGADRPNLASVAVMRRLGMRFHQVVQYPLGEGAEYVLHRDDAGPVPRSALIPWA